MSGLGLAYFITPIISHQSFDIQYSDISNFGNYCKTSDTEGKLLMAQFSCRNPLTGCIFFVKLREWKSVRVKKTE
ncbi:hypothetical protein NJ959_28545, partial [Symplocastrum sp. BBK-W-15]|nr:hypothetical protein [Limnofasciculus baicalensis BBK-W-15]